MALFERVFRGSDEMFFKAEAEVDAAIAELGASAPIAMPSTAYHLACSYAYLGKKIPPIQKILGHTRLATTLIYQEVMTETMVKDLKEARHL